MAIVILQHSDIAHVGRLGATLRDHGFKLDIRRPDRGQPGPNPIAHAVPTDLDNLHALIILGGAMNVTDIDRLPWMQSEAALIRKAHAAELPVIGICLGAQLIAHALGGEVQPRPAPSIGFDPVAITTAGQVETMLAGIAWNHHALFSCGQEITKLPPGATLLASSPKTRNIIFKAGIRTYGFINHFECDRVMSEKLLADDADLLQRAGKTPTQAAAELDQHYQTFARLSDRLCINLATYLFPSRQKLAG